MEEFVDVMDILPPHSWEIIIPDISLPSKALTLGLWEGYEKARHMWGFCIHSWLLILSLAKDKTLPSSPPFHFQKEQFPSAAAQTLFLCS